MAKRTEASIEGIFQHLIHAPDGSVEGALVEVDGEPAQWVVAHGDDALGLSLTAVKVGQRVVANATLQGPSPKGPSEHPVYALTRLRSVDGAKPAKVKAPARTALYQGRIERFNYARHGERNGVVLDTGDFLHLKPKGMAKAKLKVGDTVTADGDAWPLATGGGYVVEATVVNGKPVVR